MVQEMQGPPQGMVQFQDMAPWASIRINKKLQTNWNSCITFWAESSSDKTVWFLHEQVFVYGFALKLFRKGVCFVQGYYLPHRFAITVPWYQLQSKCLFHYGLKETIKNIYTINWSLTIQISNDPLVLCNEPRLLELLNRYETYSKSGRGMPIKELMHCWKKVTVMWNSGWMPHRKEMGFQL